MENEEIKEAVASGLREWKSSNVKVPAPLTKQNNDGFIQWKVDPTYAGVALMVKDLMILRIISDSQWKYQFILLSPFQVQIGWALKNF